MPQTPDLTREPRDDGHKKLEVVAQGHEVKASPAEKAMKSIFSGTLESVGRYLVEDVLVPTAKDMITSAVTGALETALYGERRTQPKSSGYVSYSMASGPRSGSVRQAQARREREERRSAESGYRPICVTDRAEAEVVVSQLREVADRYDYATLGDYYSLVGITQNYTDEDWGWSVDDLDRVQPRRTRDGWLIDLPTPSYLKNRI